MTDSMKKWRISNTSAHSIENIVRGFVEALNKRNFSAGSPAWRHTSPNFRSFPDLPMQGRSLLHRNRTGKDNGFTLQQMLDFMSSQISESNPNFQVDVLEVTIQEQHEGAVIAYANTRGNSVFSDGVVVEHVGVLEFVQEAVEDRWTCVQFTGMRGFM